MELGLRRDKALPYLSLRRSETLSFELALDLRLMDALTGRRPHPQA